VKVEKGETVEKEKVQKKDKKTRKRFTAKPRALMKSIKSSER
jgi:hypothetical protein